MKTISEGRPINLKQRVLNRRNDRALPKLRDADVEPLLLPLIELTLNGCRYPYDQPSGGVLFCGLTKLSSMSYCPEHHDLCHKPLDRMHEQKFMRSISRAAGLAVPSSSAA
jgi:hypothetical protein